MPPKGVHYNGVIPCVFNERNRLEAIDEDD